MIYRLNYNRNASYNGAYIYQTTHTKKIRTIGVSPRETFFATGSEDFTIEVVRTIQKAQICKFITFNQLRVLIFHPLHDDILYSATVNDAIRKWNITNCSKLV
jgi:WD40 repeat protein